MASAAFLAWRWVIEALADHEQADTSLLKALVTRDPSVLTDAPLPVKERVALRYLEDFSGLRIEDGAAPLASVSDGGIYAGLSSEVVLCHHLREVTTLCNNEKGKAGSLKQDLHQFILRKKATLPKSSLQLLKESILEGCQQSVSSLKESSGLTRSDQVDNLHGDNAEDHVCAKRLKLSTDNGRIHLLKQNTAAFSCDSGSHVVLQESPESGHDLHEQNILDGNRENHMHDDIVGTSDNDGKLLKPTSNSQPPCKRNDHVHDASLNGSQKHESSPLCPKGYDVRPNVVPEMPSDGGDVYHDISPNIDENVNMLDTEKQQCWSSRLTINHESMTNDWTEKGLCIKCVRGGQLLSCSSSGCSTAVHESCLGSVAYFEEDGLFYCPYCSYTRAFNAYRMGKKNFSRTRKALSAFIGEDLICGLHKNLLSASVLGGSSTEFIREKNHDCNVHSKQCEKNTTIAKEQHKQGEFADMHQKGNLSSRDTQILLRGRRHDVSPNAKGINNDKGITKVKHCRQTGRDDILDNVKLHFNGTSLSRVQEMPDANLINRQNDVGNGCEHDGLAEQQDLQEPAKKEDISHTRDACDDTEPKEQCQVTVGNDLLHIKQSKNQVQEKISLDCETTINSLEHDGPTSQNSERYAKRRWQGTTIEKPQLIQETVEVQNRKKFFSVRHSKHKIKSKGYSNPITPQGRRTKLLWTLEEEEALKIAVQKFAVSSGGSYPWTKILEFGHHVFHKTRLPCDLKDKWRNMRIKEGLKAK